MQWNHCYCFTHTPGGQKAVLCVGIRSFQVDLIQFSSSGMWHQVTDWMVAYILKETVRLSSCIKHSSSYCLITKDERTMILWNFRKHSPSDSTSQKAWILHYIAARISNFAMTEMFLYFQMTKQNRGIICTCQEMLVAYMVWNYRDMYLGDQPCECGVCIEHFRNFMSPSLGVVLQRVWLFAGFSSWRTRSDSMGDIRWTWVGIGIGFSLSTLVVPPSFIIQPMLHTHSYVIQLH